MLSVVYGKPLDGLAADRLIKLRSGTSIDKVDYFWHKIVKKIDNYPGKTHHRSSSDAFRFPVRHTTAFTKPAGSGSTSNPATRQNSPKRKQFCEPVDSTLYLLKALGSGEKPGKKLGEQPATGRCLLTSRKLELRPLVSSSKNTLSQTGFQSLLPRSKSHTLAFDKKSTRAEEFSPEQSNTNFMRSASLLTAQRHKKFSSAATTRVTSIVQTPGKAYNIFDVKPSASKLDFQVAPAGQAKAKVKVEFASKDKTRDFTKTETHDFKIKHHKSYRRQLTHSLAGSDTKAFKTSDEPAELQKFEDSQQILGKTGLRSEHPKQLGSAKGLTPLAVQPPRQK